MADADQDKAFARHLVRIGIVTSEEIEQARQAQTQASASGQPISLPDALVQEGIITSGQRTKILSQVADKEQGVKQIGQYKLIRKLGVGGMGAVFLAEDTMLQRQVAIKVLPRKFADDAQFLTRFQREAKAAGNLIHENICGAYAVGEEQGHHFYAMEYCEGETLGDRMKHLDIMETDEAIDAIIQAARGLGYAHERGFVHRDIKPDNIFITHEGVAKILDLGLTKNLDSEDQAHLTQSGMAVGTPHYISPEQAAGETEQLDGRTDIYSLGATLYHLVAGMTPFEGGNATAVMVKHMNEELPNPKDLNPDLPDDIVGVIDRMMAKDPADRYADCGELIEDLERLRGGQSLGPKTTGFRSSVARAGRTPGAPGSGRTTGPRGPIGLRGGKKLKDSDSFVRPRRSTGPRSAIRPLVDAKTEAKHGKAQSGKTGLLVGACLVGVFVLGALLVSMAGPDDSTKDVSRKEPKKKRTRDASKKPPDEAEAEKALAALEAALARAVEREKGGSVAHDEALRRYQGLLTEAATVEGASGIEKEIRSSIERVEAKVREAERKVAARTVSPAPKAKSVDKPESASNAKSPPKPDPHTERASQQAAVKRFAEVLKTFDVAAKQADYVKAQALARKAASDSALKSVQKQLEALTAVASALVRAEAARQEALEALKDGKHRHFETAKKRVRGIVRKIDGDVLKVRVEGRINKQTVEYEIPIKISELKPACRSKLLAEKKPGTPDEWVAEAIRELVMGDPDAADKALVSAGDHLLQAHYRVWLAAAVREQTEAHAKQHWKEHIGPLLGVKEFKKQKATAAKKTLEAFTEKYAKTRFAGTVSKAQGELEAKIQAALGFSKDLALDLGDGRKMAFRLIPAGTFTMGSSKSVEEMNQLYGGRTKYYGYALPQHKVTLTRAFYMGSFLVTRGQFRRFVTAEKYQTVAERSGSGYQLRGSWQRVKGATWLNPGFEQTDDHPAVMIGARDAEAFCAWLSRHTRRKARLPTEAEWEYACRAGSTSIFNLGDGLDALKEAGWCSYDGVSGSAKGTCPVGRFKPNAWGLFDMHGNAWEWCQDFSGPYSADAVTDPRGAGNGTSRVVRGGSWHREPSRCVASARGYVSGGHVNSGFGFRVVVEADAPGSVASNPATPDAAPDLKRGLVAHWKFDEGKGDTAFDVSGKGNHGKLVNGPKWEPGILGGALRFDGDDDYVELGEVGAGHPLRLAGSAMTIAVWFTQKPGGDVAQRIIDKSDRPNGSNGYAVILDPSSRQAMISVNKSLSRGRKRAYAFDTWTHLALVITSEGYQIHVNGRRDTSARLDRGKRYETPPDITTNMRIGSWNHTTKRELEGALDDLRIYARALSEKEIAALVDMAKK